MTIQLVETSEESSFLLIADHIAELLNDGQVSEACTAALQAPPVGPCCTAAAATGAGASQQGRIWCPAAISADHAAGCSSLAHCGLRLAPHWPTPLGPSSWSSAAR